MMRKRAVVQDYSIELRLEKLICL